jgi:hypothetical protein
VKARIGLGVAAGVLLLLSSAAHALLGWPQFGAALADAGLDGQTVGALAVGWYFGSVSMLAFGVIVLAAAVDAARGRPVAVAPLWIIAGGYLGRAGRRSEPS